jgi:hypothetical protein
MARVLREAAKRIEELVSENRLLKQNLVDVQRSMQNILDDFNPTEHPAIEALQAVLLCAFDDEDICDDIHVENLGTIEKCEDMGPSYLVGSNSRSKRDMARERTIALLESVQRLRQQGKIAISAVSSQAARQPGKGCFRLCSGALHIHLL